MGFRFGLAGAKIAKREKSKKERSELLRRSNKVNKPLKAYYERFADVFKKLGYPISWDFTGLKLESPITFNGKKLIGVAPFSAKKGKEYPFDKLLEVIKSLSELQDVRILLFGGGEKEKVMLEQVASKYNNTESLVGRFPLSQEMAIMGMLNVMISMDSANMHLASLMNTPVVSIWGPSHPNVGFRPWGQPNTNCVQVELSCRPCSEWGAKPCYRGDWACMNNISPKIIVDKVVKFL